MLSFCLLGQLSACAQLEQLSGEHEPLFCSSAISTSLLTLSPQVRHKMASHCFAITLFIVALSPRIYQQVFL